MRLSTPPEMVAKPAAAVSGADRAPLAEAGYGTVVVHEMSFSISRSRVGYFREAHDGVVLRDYRTLIAAPAPGRLDPRLDLWIRS